MFSDIIHTALVTIFEGVKDYNDYSEVQKKNTIEVMTRLHMILLAFSRSDASEENEGDYNRCKYYAQRDFERALQGDYYCGEADEKGECNCGDD